MTVKREKLNIIFAIIFAILIIQIIVSFSGFAYLFKELWHSIYYVYRQLGDSDSNFYDYHNITTNRANLHYRLFVKFYRTALILFILLIILISIYCILKMFKLNKTIHKVLDIVFASLFIILSLACIIIVCNSVKYANGLVQANYYVNGYSYSFKSNYFNNSVYPLIYSIYDGFLTQTLSISIPTILLTLTIVVRFCFNIYLCKKERNNNENIEPLNKN